MLVGWLATYPLDVVKTRMQGGEDVPQVSLHDLQVPLISARPTLDTNPYQTIVSTIIHSYHTEGVGVFFLGLAPTIIR